MKFVIDFNKLPKRMLQTPDGRTVKAVLYDDIVAAMESQMVPKEMLIDIMKQISDSESEGGNGYRKSIDFIKEHLEDEENTTDVNNALKSLIDLKDYFKIISKDDKDEVNLNPVIDKAQAKRDYQATSFAVDLIKEQYNLEG